MNHCLRVKQIFVCSNENKQIKIRSFPSQKYRNPHAIIGEKGILWHERFSLETPHWLTAP